MTRNQNRLWHHDIDCFAKDNNEKKSSSSTSVQLVMRQNMVETMLSNILIEVRIGEIRTVGTSTPEKVGTALDFHPPLC